MKNKNLIKKVIAEHMIYMIVMSVAFGGYILLKLIFVGIAIYKRGNFLFIQVYPIMWSYGVTVIIVGLIISIRYTWKLKIIRKNVINDELLSNIMEKIEDSVRYIIGWLITAFVSGGVSILVRYDGSSSFFKGRFIDPDIWIFIFMYTAVRTIQHTVKFKDLLKNHGDGLV